MIGGGTASRCVGLGDTPDDRYWIGRGAFTCHCALEGIAACCVAALFLLGGSLGLGVDWACGTIGLDLACIKGALAAFLSLSACSRSLFVGGSGGNLLGS